MDQPASQLCGAHTRSGGTCQAWAIPGKNRCRVHGGASTGARSLDGRQRQAEGRERYFARLRGEQGGPPKAMMRAVERAAIPDQHEPVSVDPVERMRLDTLASMPQPASADLERAFAAHVEKPPLPEAPVEPRPEVSILIDYEGKPVPRASLEETRRLVDSLFASGILPLPQPHPEPSRPRLAVDNPVPVPADVSPVPLPAVVEDTSKLGREVETIAQAAIERIKELLRHPLDRADPNFAALLRFLSSTYNTSMTTIARTDDNRLKRQAVSRLDYILERAAEERRNRDERRTIEHDGGDAG